MRYSRLSVFAGLLFLFTGPAFSESLWYGQPAQSWSEALPTGNGRLGAMVFGGVPEDRLQLNEDTIWSGNKTGDYDHPGASQHVAEARALIFAGKYAEAESLAAHTMLGTRPPGAYQPLGDLHLSFPGGAKFTGYRRELDLDSAVAKTSWVEDGATFTREVFASAPQQVIVLRLTCDKPGRVSFEARLDREECAESASVGSDAIELQGQADRGKPTAGVKFVARVQAIADGGTTKSSSGVLQVANANAVTLLVSAATDFHGGDPSAQCQAWLAAAFKMSYADLRGAHLADYRALFRRVTLQIGTREDETLPTDERLRRVRDGGTDNALFALYFQFGRYLLISSSRPGGMAANLQGLWNDRIAPPWFCGYHFDINTEMNYWMAETANLSECQEPLFSLIENLQANGHKTAREVYGCDGFVTAHRTNAGWFTSPVQGFAVWPAGAGWLCQHLWEHYRFTGDRDFLARRGYPVMKEAAKFFLDWLVPDPHTGKLVSGPSVSPENSFKTPSGDKVARLVMGPAMDQEVAAELFDDCLAAAEVLGIHDDFVEKVKAARANLQAPQIGSDGRLMEWSQEYAEYEPSHRHYSHLYALYPGWEITPRATPELAAAAGKSLAQRQAHADSSQGNPSNSGNVGWSLAWSAGLWARLGNGESALRSLQLLLSRATFPNMMDNCPQKGTAGVFQIDGNLGGPAAIAEMLLQSHAGEIELLPALPAAWPEGSFSGLRARGGYEVGVTWKGGRLVRGQLRSMFGGPGKLRTSQPVDVSTSDGRTVAASKRDAFGWVAEFSSDKGATYGITPQL